MGLLLDVCRWTSKVSYFMPQTPTYFLLFFSLNVRCLFLFVVLLHEVF